MDIAAALDFARTTKNSVLTTIKRDGRPQMSNVTHGVDGAGLILISITADRAKFFNITRDQRVSLYVTRADFMAYAVLDGHGELAPVSADPNDATVDALVAFYRAIAGEHPDWGDYRRAMVADRRTLVRMSPTHVYGWLG